MKVAKLSIDRIVQVLKPAQPVVFDKRQNLLVCNSLLERPGKIDPYWISETLVVWIMEFK